MIGDPKQAIYAFRGADVFTKARTATEATTTHSKASVLPMPWSPL